MSERKRLFQDMTLEEQTDMLAEIAGLFQLSDIEEYNRQTGQNIKAIRQEPYKPEKKN